MLKDIHIQDSAFFTDKSSSKYHSSKYINWRRDFYPTNVCFFSDMMLGNVDLPIYRDKFKVAWLIEPAATIQFGYNYCVQNQEKFDLILTHHKDLLKYGEKFQYYPNLMSWVDEKDFGIHPKSENLSIIASNKAHTPGQKIRHEIVRYLKGEKLLDDKHIYGIVYQPIKDKITALKDYRFTFCIENCRVDDYYSEKILDSILTGTIPIFWGSSKIGDTFNSKGIIQFNSREEVSEIVKNITSSGEEIYNQMLPYVKENYETALKLGPVAEDWIFLNILKPKKLV